ncbi:MAG: hypothetical protein HQM08_23400 [Candidatus Riflebacteria bacterium]|nr:hypothetical protein [Candidatus Riflebacteria bacterium]
MNKRLEGFVFLTFFLLLGSFVQANEIAGISYPVEAQSTKSGKVWPAIFLITSQDSKSGKIEGQIEWKSLKTINKIAGRLSHGNLSFKEVEHIKNKGAQLLVNLYLH